MKNSTSLKHSISTSLHKKTGQVGNKFRLSCLVAPTGIEPVSRAPETLILSIELRSRNSIKIWNRRKFSKEKTKSYC